MSEPRFYTSPVDYEAWRKGYMTPSEHILIDALHRGEAKVVSSFRSVGEVGWWFVFENPDAGISTKKAEMIKKLLEMDLETLVEKFDAIMAAKVEKQPVFDYSELSEAEMTTPTPEMDNLIKHSKVISEKRGL